MFKIAVLHENLVTMTAWMWFLLCVYHHMLCKIIFNCKTFSQCLPWYGSSPVCIMKWYFKWIPRIYDVRLLRCQLNLGNGWWCQRRIATIPYKEVNVVIYTPFGLSMLEHCQCRRRATKWPWIESVCRYKDTVQPVCAGVHEVTCTLV